MASPNQGPRYRGNSQELKEKFKDYCSTSSKTQPEALDHILAHFFGSEQPVAMLERDKLIADVSNKFSEKLLRSGIEEKELRTILCFNVKAKKRAAIKHVLKYIFDESWTQFIGDSSSKLPFSKIIESRKSLSRDIFERTKFSKLTTEECLNIFLQCGLSIDSYDKLKQKLKEAGYDILRCGTTISTEQANRFASMADKLGLKATSSIGCALDPVKVFKFLKDINPNLDTYENVLGHDGYPSGKDFVVAAGLGFVESKKIEIEISGNRFFPVCTFIGPETYTFFKENFDILNDYAKYLTETLNIGIVMVTDLKALWAMFVDHINCPYCDCDKPHSRIECKHFDAEVRVKFSHVGEDKVLLFKWVGSFLICILHMVLRITHHMLEILVGLCMENQRWERKLIAAVRKHNVPFSIFNKKSKNKHKDEGVLPTRTCTNHNGNECRIILENLEEIIEEGIPACDTIAEGWKNINDILDYMWTNDLCGALQIKNLSGEVVASYYPTAKKEEYPDLRKKDFISQMKNKHKTADNLRNELESEIESTLGSSKDKRIVVSTIFCKIKELIDILNDGHEKYCLDLSQVSRKCFLVKKLWKDYLLKTNLRVYEHTLFDHTTKILEEFPYGTSAYSNQSQERFNGTATKYFHCHSTKGGGRGKPLKPWSGAKLTTKDENKLTVIHSLTPAKRECLERGLLRIYVEIEVKNEIEQLYATRGENVTVTINYKKNPASPRTLTSRINQAKVLQILPTVRTRLFIEELNESDNETCNKVLCI